MLSLESSLISLQGDVESRQHFIDFVHLTVHGSSAKSDDWLHHELHESSLELLTIIILVVVGTFLPFLSFSVVIVVTPKLGSHFFSVDTEFDAVHISEFGKSESPAEKSGTHGTSTNLWINLEFLIHIFVFISGNDNIDVLNNSNEVLVHGFSINLELENSSVNFVNHKYWLILWSPRPVLLPSLQLVMPELPTPERTSRKEVLPSNLLVFLFTTRPMLRSQESQ